MKVQMKPQSNWLTLIPAFALGLALCLPAFARAGAPTEQIRTTVDKAIVVLKDPRYSGKKLERRDQLKEILFSRFDFIEMAKRSLGPHWRDLSEAEQKEFVGLFSDLLERTYAEIIESYTDEKVVYLNERTDGSFAEVASKVQSSKGVDYSVNYKVQLNGSEWKVYDIVAENISLVNNYRSQFNTVVKKYSYQELVNRLKSKSDFGGAPKK
jgi:phospholipid transport system substrate-binding protein